MRMAKGMPNGISEKKVNGFVEEIWIEISATIHKEISEEPLEDYAQRNFGSDFQKNCSRNVKAISRWFFKDNTEENPNQLKGSTKEILKKFPM